MTNIEKNNFVVDAYITHTKDSGKEIHILNDTMPDEVQEALREIQRGLDTAFDISYDIMYDACNIISNKTLLGTGRDSLVSDELDFFADADSQANVYTGVQLSYLSVNNEQEISDLMQDESVTSIAQACSVWYSQKVAEACEEIKQYILNE